MGEQQTALVAVRTGGAPPEPKQTFSLRDGLAILFRRRWSALLLFSAIVGAGFVWNHYAQPVYESRASILVKKGRAEVPMAAKDSAQLIIHQVREEDLNTEMVLLRSRETVQQVLQHLGDPTTWPASLKPDEESTMAPEELMLVHLERSLDISTVTGSNIIEVAYRSGDPDWAVRVVKTATEQYLDRRSRVFQSPQAVTFFEEQMQDAETRLRASEDQLSQFLDSSGVTMLRGSAGGESLAAEKQLIMNSIGDLEKQAAQAAGAIREREKEIAALQTRLNDVPERLVSANRSNVDAGIEELERALVALELERDALKQTYLPTNSKVQEVETKIALLRDRLKEKQEGVGDINRTEINPIHQTLKTQLLASQTNLEGIRARYASVQTQLMQYRNQLTQLNDKGMQLQRLQREFDAAEQAFVLYQRKHEEARISAAMDEERIVNVTIAQPALRPFRPIAPNKKRNLALAIIVATISAAGLVLGLEHFNHTLTSGYELEQRLGIPELASIPEQK